VALEIVMPALEMAQNSGILVRWLKVEGESVVKGEPLMEIETDKATVEIESPGTGILSNVSAQAGDEVPVGRVIAVLLEQKEKLPRTVENISGASSAPAVGSSLVGSVLPIDPSTKKKTPIPSNDFKLLPASPKARRMVQARGLKLSALHGSGRDGAVLSRDVLQSEDRKERDEE